MVVLTKKKGESRDSFFRKFTRMFIEENILDEVRKKQFYKKPSLMRKDEEKERKKNKSKIKRGFFRDKKPVRKYL